MTLSLEGAGTLEREGGGGGANLTARTLHVRVPFSEKKSFTRCLLLAGSSEFEGKVENMTLNTLQYPGAIQMISQNNFAVFVLIFYAV